MVSVVVPIYNVEDYIDRCLESIVNQTFKDIEIILINDGSTDESLKKCIEWLEKDDRIILADKKNEGLGFTRNLGIDLASGEYIIFVDSDDWIELETIEKMHKVITKTEADIVVGDINYVNLYEDEKVECNTSKLRIEPNKLVKTEENMNLINTVRTFLWGKLYRRNLFIKNNIKQPANEYEDVATMPLLVLKAEYIYRIPEAFYNYVRNRSESIVNNLNSLSSMRKSLELLKKEFENENSFEKYNNELRRLSSSQVRFVYRKINENNSVLNDLYKFMDLNYEGWFNFSKHNISVIGSEYLKKAVGNICFNKETLHLDKVEKNDDYILLDLLSYAYSEEYLNKYLNEYLNIFKERIISQKVLLVKLFFEDINENKETNSLLEKYYEKIIKANREITVIHIKDRISKHEDKLDEDILWNLSDEILDTLENLQRVSGV